MTALDVLKNRLIDRISASTNSDLLEAIEKIIVSTHQNETMSLTQEQIEMLILSEHDIQTGNLVSEEELEELNKQWFK
jgi:hypothetical protein